jgi:hypothetical protein
MADLQVPTVTKTRSEMAWLIVSVGVVGITAISVAAIWLAAKSERSATTQMVFTAVLPLLGTWVGAVLAYYFSKDNLQAASQTTLQAVRAVGGGAATEGATVKDVMIPLNRIRPRVDVADDAAAKAQVLRHLYDTMVSSGMSRVPIFSDDVVIYVVHQPDIDRYAQSKGVACTALANTDTLQALMLDPEGAKDVSRFATVTTAATVAEARAALAKESEAKDLFVTEDGSKSSKVLGWLTNSDLARSA